MNAFTEALHYELKGTGVSCTLLAPGPVRDAVVPDEEQSIVDKVVPDFLWTTYESCSAETLEAMAKPTPRGSRPTVEGDERTQPNRARTVDRTFGRQFLFQDGLVEML